MEYPVAMLGSLIPQSGPLMEKHDCCFIQKNVSITFVFDFRRSLY